MPYSQKQWQDRIKDAQGNVIQEGTPFSAGNMNRIEQGISDAHSQLESSARQTQTLKHGLQVLNGGVNSPVNIQIEGRTLIPMQNTVLDPLKYYVLADNKTKLKWADTSITAGVAKFTAKSERPTIIRVANFEGKVPGSTLENPHVASGLSATSNTLQPLNGTWSEILNQYGTMFRGLDGDLFSDHHNGNGNIVQTRFSFDILQEIERKIGRIPRSTVADKVQWLKDNINNLIFKWHGYGSSPSGNKATVKGWDSINVGWSVYAPNNLTGSVSQIIFPISSVDMATYIDSNGLAYFIAYADPSDGVTASTINTDYVELEIELKPTAILHDPSVQLYEVPQADYDKILVTWLEAEVLARYPQVAEVQHIQNPYVMAEGENLIPSFSEWGLNTSTKVIDAYDIEFNAPDGIGVIAAAVTIPVIPGQTYNLGSGYEGTSLAIQATFRKGSQDLVHIIYNSVNYLPVASTAPSGCDSLYIAFYTTAAGLIRVKQPMLTLGITAKPFVPRNPSYLLVETKLGAIGNVSDLLYEQDGKYMVRKAIEEDVVLDGSLNWAWNGGINGGKEFKFINPKSPALGTAEDVLTKFTGKLLKSRKNFSTPVEIDEIRFYGDIFVGVSNTDTGFTDTYTPTADEIKAYFNGWQVKTVDGSNVPTSWKSVVDGTDAPTQTLVYVSTNKAPNYTPYKLSYVLATPQITEAKTEGAISVNGLTQVEVGSALIFKEQVTPTRILSIPDRYRINNKYSTAVVGANYLDNPALEILAIYKDDAKDTKWMIYNNNGDAGNANGFAFADVFTSDYDPTAKYTVTYIAFNKHLFTNNITNLIAQYANNIRTALDDTVKKVEEVKTESSVNTLLLYDVLKRLKAGGL